MEKVRGSAARSIVIPGYHLCSKYDLKHTRHLLESRKGKKNFALMLAPMVDMFSILVIYLIMNFSTTGEAFFIAKEIKIPQATKGIPMETYPLVSVVGDKVTFDAPALEGEPAVFIEEPNDGENNRLRQKLREIRDLEKRIGGEQGFRGQVNIQADENMEVDQVKRVMRVLIEEGWNTINFIVEPNSQLGK